MIVCTIRIITRFNEYVIFVTNIIVDNSCNPVLNRILSKRKWKTPVKSWIKIGILYSSLMFNKHFKNS